MQIARERVGNVVYRTEQLRHSLSDELVLAQQAIKADSYRGGGIPGGSDDAEVQIAYRSSF